MEHKERKEHKKHVKLKKKDLWMWISIALAVILIISIYTNGFRAATGKTLTKKQASEEALDYINKYLLTGTTATLMGVEEDSGMYVLKMTIQGREFESYVTKDGDLLFPQGIDITTEPEVAEQPQAEVETVVSDPEEIEGFLNCLKEANFKIYGANWCGWTNKLVTMFGGFDAVEPIYVECTENKELCDNAEVTGYPTIVINEEKYAGERSFKAFAEATGCAMPSGIEVKDSASTDTSSCS